MVSAIPFVARIGSGDGSLGPMDIANEEPGEEEVDSEAGVVKEGSKKDADDEPGLSRESPESLCEGGSVPIDDSTPEPPSDSADESLVSCRKDEFKL